MELIITEKNDAAQQISRLLADGKPKNDKVYNTPVYRFTRDGKECVIIGLRGHILGVDFPTDLVYSKKDGWQGVEADGELIPAPDVPKSLPTPPWEKKRRPYTADGINLKTWKIPALPYLTYAPIIKLPAEKDIIRSLKNLAKKADSVIIATDFDREGELIGLDAISMVREVNADAPITRARYSAFVKKEIEEAFAPENLHPLDYDLAHAGESRQYIDLIWGAVLTRYLTLVKYSGFGNVRSSGRVQTPTLALVVEREKERMAFIPDDYWVITGLAAPKGTKVGPEGEGAIKITYQAEENLKGHGKDYIAHEEEADAVMRKISSADEGTVVSVEKKERRRPAPAPFNTTSLMAAASSIGIKPARCMRLAESLYMAGLTSYPRVDNTYYPDGLDFREVLGTLAKVPELREQADKLLSRSKLTATHGKKRDTDHPPIYPTGAADRSKLRDDEWRLYNLIARRFMATLSDPAVFEDTKVAVEVEGEPFTAGGAVLKVPGWRGVYQYGLGKDEQMPALEEGDTVDFSRPQCDHKQTNPPARYSSGKLIQVMEQNGLGTKATRHDMIEKLASRHYIEGDPIAPTQLGFAVIEALEKFAKQITTPDMTAELEDEMTQVADGKRDRDDVVLHSRKLLGGIVDELIPAKDQIADAITDAVIADSRVGTCPKCGGDLCVKSSAKTRSNFVGCNNWPDCDVTYPLPQGHYDAVEEPCPVCGSPQIKVTPFRAKAYVHCLNPECETNKMPEIDVGECPTCKAAGREGRLIAQKNPRTLKRFIRCTNYDECGVSYPLPQRGELKATGEVCDACGAPEVIVTTSRGPWRICVNMDCPKREQAKVKKGARGSKGKSAKAKGGRKKATGKSASAKGTKSAGKSTKKKADE